MRRAPGVRRPYRENHARLHHQLESARGRQEPRAGRSSRPPFRPHTACRCRLHLGLLGARRRGRRLRQSPDTSARRIPAARAGAGSENRRRRRRPSEVCACRTRWRRGNWRATAGRARLTRVAATGGCRAGAVGSDPLAVRPGTSGWQHKDGSVSARCAGPGRPADSDGPIGPYCRSNSPVSARKGASWDEAC